MSDSLTGVDLIAAERKRQIEEEGWSEFHDDGHDLDELAFAAVCYALPHRERYAGAEGLPFYWPGRWLCQWWKPSPNDRVRELVKAGALIAAEIDRLKRKEKQA